MKKRIWLKHYVIHILAMPTIDEEAFDIPLDQVALIACTKIRTTPFLIEDPDKLCVMVEYDVNERARCAGGGFNNTQTSGLQTCREWEQRFRK